LKKPYITLIGVPGSGKSTLESALYDRKKLIELHMNGANPGWVSCILGFIVCIVFLVACFLFLDRKKFGHKKFLSTGRKLLQSQSPRFDDLAGEGVVTLMVRTLSIMRCTNMLAKIFIPQMLFLYRKSVFVVIDVDQSVAIERVESKKTKALINKQFLVSRQFRERYICLVDLVIHMLRNKKHIVLNANTKETPDDMANDIVDKICESY